MSAERGMGKWVKRLTAGVLLAGLVSGCATMDQKVSILYEPTIKARLGSGDLYVATSADQSGTAANVQWVVGSVKDTDGNKVGDILSPTAPVAVIRDALTQELTAAGYSVTTGPLPAGVTKGVVISGATIELGETTSIVKAEARGKVSITLDLWKNGRLFRKLSYESGFSDFAVKDRDLLLPGLLQKGIQDILSRAVPEISRALELQGTAPAAQ